MRLVPVKYLKGNTEIAIDIINDEGKLLLKKGQKISQSGIASLEKLGIFHVYIQDEYCLNNNVQSSMDLCKVYSSVTKLKEIANRVADGVSNQTDIVAAISVAKVIIEDIISLKDKFKITYEPNKMVVNSIVERSIYVAMMSTALGIRMNLSKERLIKLCLASLLKDLALVSPKIKSNVKDVYHYHPLLAYQYLKETYKLDEEILNAVLHHHELYDGSGFPNKLKGDEICEFARIIGIIDLFYEIKSNHDMLNETQEMFEYKLSKIVKMFDIKILSYFFKDAELFTLDTLVRLNTGDIAVIIENNFTNIFRPIIKIIKGKVFKQGQVIELVKYSKLKIHNIEYYV